MQETSPAIPHWAYTILQALAWLGAGGTIVKLITIYQNRGKPKAEIHETEARATEINVRSTIKLMDRLDIALSEVDRIRLERDVAREERDGLRRTVDKQSIELELGDKQMKRIHGIMDSLGIKLSDYDFPKQ